jgi:hypothetical protein
MHPTSHPLLWEEEALQALHGLELVGVLDDLAGLAAVLLELPRRETGGWLPDFDENVDLSFRCAEAGVALHLDGARLWQCGPAYAPRTLADVVALADDLPHALQGPRCRRWGQAALPRGPRCPGSHPAAPARRHPVGPVAGGLRPGPREGTAALEISTGVASLEVPPLEAAELLQRVCDLAG